jgi:DNA polymerase alpha-associated DNA helicase A
MKDTMDRLREKSNSDLSFLSEILLGQTVPSSPDKLECFKFVDETLNDSQKEAVRFALSAPELALIHGPPGVPQL